MDGAPKEALDTLRADAKVNLDDIRDKHAEDANCSPEARSSKQALQGKLDAYRKALTDMESARAQVENGKGAGAALEKATTLASANDAVKSTMDAAMDLFGAANGVFLGGNKSGEALGAVYSAAQGVISASRAATPDQAAEAGIVLNLTKAAATKLPDYAPLNLALAAGDVGTKLIETSKLRDDKTIEPTARDLQTAGNGTQILGTGIGALGELPYTTVAARTSAGALIHTTDYKVVTVNPVKAMGTAVSAVGTVVSTSINYDRELGKAFDTIAAGQDEHREYDALSESTMRQIGAKRVEFMEKIAALEAEIGRSGCIK